MSEMISLLCRHVDAAMHGGFDAKQHPEHQDVVIAVLRALREPSPAMLRAAGAAMLPDKRPTPEHVRYQAMIDEVLK